MKTKKFKINVTQRDIDLWVNAKVDKNIRACKSCAVAMAIKRHKQLKNFEVGYWAVISSEFSIRHSTEVYDFIRAIDRKKANLVPQIEILPLKFTLEVPIEYL